MTEPRTMKHGEMIREAGHCERPGCHNAAEWKIVYTDATYSYVCPRHATEIAKATRGDRATPSLAAEVADALTPRSLRPADEDRAGGQNTLTRFADLDEA